LGRIKARIDGRKRGAAVGTLVYTSIIAYIDGSAPGGIKFYIMVIGMESIDYRSSRRSNGPVPVNIHASINQRISEKGIDGNGMRKPELVGTMIGR
jgi:hypothetical protein